MKIMHTFIVLLVISLVIFGGVSVFVFQKLEDANKEFANFDAKSKEILNLEKLNRQVHRVWVMAMFLKEAEGIPEEEETFNQKLVETAIQYNALFEEFKEGEKTYDISTYVDESYAHDREVENVVKAVTEGEEPSIVHELIKTGRATGSALIEKLDDFEILADKEAREAERTYLASVNSVVRFAFPVMIGVIFLILLSVFLLVFFILKPIKKLTDVVDEVSKGRLDVKIEKSNIDEVNKLGEALDRVMTTMKRAIKRVKPSRRTYDEEEGGEGDEFDDMKSKFEQFQEWQQGVKKMGKKK